MSGASTPPRRASDLAYEQLRARIVDLRLPPGSQLNEAAVAAELGLGRMPVHEAVARLATERFVTVVPRRSTTVSVLQLADVLTMFEAREAELGGSPNSPHNLWPEPGAAPNPKDKLETALHDLVCSYRMTLTDAQNAIAGDWVSAYRQVLGTPPPTR